MIPSHTVIVCTRNRPDDLKRCLEHILNSSHVPKILIIDSSDDPRTKEVVESARPEIQGHEIRYFHTLPGLPHQRNIGLNHTQTEIVHFVDDDSYVSKEYFEKIIEAFERNPKAVGVGGLQVREPMRPPHWSKRLFLLAAGPGRVSKSAYNTCVYRIDDRDQHVDWLSGCAMSFRTMAAKETRFGDFLSGYALGEDMEFCLRVSRHGDLIVNTESWVDHVRSEKNRLDYRQFRKSDMVNRNEFVQRFPQVFSRPAYVWSAAGIMILTALRSLGGSTSAQDELRGIWDGLRSVLSRRRGD